MSLLDDSVDFVQRTLKCCGGERPSDWSNSAWEHKSLEHRSKVPDSCCAEHTVPKGFQNGVCGVSGSWRDGLHPGVWQQGCGDSLVQVIKEKLVIVVSVGLGIAGIQVSRS
ncbi:hypothetical protein LSH36_337g04001 [Paralvinella palmiformis]|uniref:Uncharacterized protein n=1 Tax=Paralvinella palmiformis TaxID=53620 RepID=A0AAD9JGF8_9ANNE|nr:hypothetical protein LSH36_337g04001 [Paralvinella palmiformis]